MILLFNGKIMKIGIFINTTKSEANTTASAFGKALNDNGMDYKIVNLKEDCKDVDAIAGATVTSNGYNSAIGTVFEALKIILKEAP